MEEFKRKRLGDVVDINYGKDHKKLNDGIIPTYGSGGVMRYVDEHLFNDESILIPRKGTLSNIFYVNEPFWTVDTIFWTKIDKNLVFPKFLFYQLLTKDFLSMNVGTAVPSLTVKVLNEIEIKLPPLPTQRKIADILSSLDDKIENNRKTCAKLEEVASAVFKRWFVDEADERNGKISITDLFEIRDGTHDSPKQKECGKKLVTSKHLTPNGIDLKSAYNISNEDYEKINKRSKVDTHDVLISMIGTVGRLHLEQSDRIDYAIKNIGLFKTSQNPDWSEFIYFWLQSEYGRNYIFENLRGSTQKYISLTSLRRIAILKLEKGKLLEFNSLVKPLMSVKNKKQIENKTLQYIRDVLLPKLISGELSVEV